MMIQDKLLLLEEKLDKLLAEYNAVKQERDLLLEKNNSLLIHIGNIETENSLLKQNKEKPSVSLLFVWLIARSPR